MKLFFKEYFAFRKSERNAILVLLLIIGTVVLVLCLDSSTKVIRNNELYNLPVDSIFIFPKKSKSNFKKNVLTDRNVGMFRFDPNNTTVEEWLKLGFKKWQISVVNSYLEKAMKFKNKEHFLSLKIFSKSERIRLDEYVYILQDTIDINMIEENVQINLNSCVSDELRTIKGIGFSYSNRIVKYRNTLGGFYNTTQLIEVYGLDSSFCDSILQFLYIDTSLLRKININKCPAQVLYNHPYINWNVANAIVNYRDQHGEYKTVLEIQKTDLVNPDLYRKIAPYFSLVE